MNDTNEKGQGRQAPPVEHQFLKGQSGNKRGRPKGSVCLKNLTRKVAHKKHSLKVNGEVVRDTLLNLVIDTLNRRAAAGQPAMVKLKRELRAKLRPNEQIEGGGLLVVPRTLSAEEWTAQAERHNAVARNPETYIDHANEEWLKALRGEPASELGKAMLVYHHRWRRH